MLNGGSSQLIGLLDGFDPVYHPVPSATDINNHQTKRKPSNPNKEVAVSAPAPDGQLIDLTDNAEKTQNNPKQTPPSRKSPRTSDISIVAVKDSAQVSPRNPMPKTGSAYFNSGPGVQLRKPAPVMKNSKRGKKLTANMDMAISGVIFQALASVAVQNQSESTTQNKTKSDQGMTQGKPNTDDKMAKQAERKEDPEKRNEATTSKQQDDIIELTSSGELYY